MHYIFALSLALSFLYGQGTYHSRFLASSGFLRKTSFRAVIDAAFVMITVGIVIVVCVQNSRYHRRVVAIACGALINISYSVM